MIECVSKSNAPNHQEKGRSMSTRLEDWTDRKWRPMMGWTYIVICIFDFTAAPVLWSLIQAFFKGNVTEQWVPLTLQGAGLFHLAMGSILGVTAWSRGQEKMTGTNLATAAQPQAKTSPVTYNKEENNG